MIITSGRQDVVDFSSRYMDYSVSIIMATSKDTENGFGFLDPLDPHVWTCFLGTFFHWYIRYRSLTDRE